MSFNKNRFAFVIVLSFAISILLGIHAQNSGPQISSVSYDNTAFPSAVTLTMNTRIDEESQPVITIEPHIPFELNINSRVVSVRFDETLNSDTEYTISIENMRDTRDKISEAEHSFHTATNSYVYLERNENRNDAIYEKIVSGEKKLLYESETIYDFVHGKKTLLVAEKVNDDIRLIEASKGRKILTEPVGTLRSLYGSLFGDLYVISYVQEDSRSTETYVYDATNNTFELLQEDGNPIEILEATVAEDGQTLLYRDKSDFTLYVDNIYDTKPALPLGVISKIVRYFPDNSGVAVERPERNPGLINVIETFSGNVTDVDLGLTTSLSTLSKDLTAYAVRVDFTGTDLETDVVKIVDQQASDLYSPDPNMRIHDINISVNDEFISLELSPKPVIYDNYSLNSQPQNSTIKILHSNGELIEEVFGSSAQWRYLD